MVQSQARRYVWQVMEEPLCILVFIWLGFLSLDFQTFFILISDFQIFASWFPQFKLQPSCNMWQAMEERFNLGLDFHICLHMLRKFHVSFLIWLIFRYQLIFFSISHSWWDMLTHSSSIFSQSKNFHSPTIPVIALEILQSVILQL